MEKKLPLKFFSKRFLDSLTVINNLNGNFFLNRCHGCSMVSTWCLAGVL